MSAHVLLASQRDGHTAPPNLEHAGQPPQLLLEGANLVYARQQSDLRLAINRDAQCMVEHPASHDRRPSEPSVQTTSSRRKSTSVSCGAAARSRETWPSRGQWRGWCLRRAAGLSTRREHGKWAERHACIVLASIHPSMRPSSNIPYTDTPAPIRSRMQMTAMSSVRVSMCELSAAQC